MNEKLVVKIPRKYSGPEIENDEIEELMIEHQSLFEPLFERILDTGDGRIQLVNNSLEVEQVDFDESDGSGTVDVEFLSSFYAGCKDINSADWHQETLSFTVLDGFLVFDIDMPIPWHPDN